MDKVREREAFLASPEIFRILVERAQIGVLVLQDQRIIFANQQIASLTGYPVKSLTDGSVPISQLIAPEDRGRVAEEIRQREAGVIGHPHELRCIRQDGSGFDARVWGVLVNIDQRPADLVTLHDVSETNQTLKALKERTQLLADAEQLGNMGSGSLDLSNGQLMLSAGFLRLLGETSENQAVDMPWLLAHIPEADKVVLQSIYGSLVDGKAREATHRLERADGRMCVVLHRGVVELDAQGRPCRLRGVVHDITERRQAEQRAHRLAYFDPITQLPNRQSLQRSLAESLRLPKEAPDTSLALLILEVDQLPMVSKTLGYSESDRLLKVVADRLASTNLGMDILAHLGGGEYAAVLQTPHIGGRQAVVAAAHAFLQSLAEPISLNGHEVFVSCQIGVALSPQDGDDPEQLLRQAQAAIRQGREAGEHQITFFAAQVDERLGQRLALEASLRRALEREEFFLLYQPQLSLATGKIIGVEALVRWREAKRGELLPCEFIPLAEETGLIIPIGEWILRTACAQARAWQQSGIQVPRMAVNLSSRQLQQSDVVRRIEAILLETGLDPRLLSLQMTEAMVMENIGHVARALGELQAIGIEIALDDFGTGYSSLSHLGTLPINVVKVDRSFVNDVTASPQSVSMTRAIIDMAHGLQMKVLAEGVENEGQLALLIAHRCDQFQGAYFSEPVAAPDIEAMLLAGRQLPETLLNRQAAKRTLLLVDDEENIVSSLRRLLRRDGYNIVFAHSGAEGLQRLAEQQIDVIVSDQRMPGMTGVEFLRRAKELYPDTIRIVLSGYTELQSITDAINEGAIYKFLTKPWDDDLLRSHIEEAFRQKEMVDENSRLDGEVKDANRELAHVNKRLQQLLETQQAQIGQDEARLVIGREVLESIPIPIIGIDNDGSIVFVNPAAEHGIEAGAMLIGQHVEDALEPSLLAAWRSSEGEAQQIDISGQRYRAVCRAIVGDECSRGKILVLIPAAAPLDNRVCQP